jgi:hypothetical protein
MKKWGKHCWGVTTNNRYVWLTLALCNRTFEYLNNQQNRDLTIGTLLLWKSSEPLCGINSINMRNNGEEIGISFNVHKNSSYVYEKDNRVIKAKRITWSEV